MDQSTSRAELAFEEAVWADVMGRLGAVGARCREVYRDAVAKYRSLGLTPSGAGVIVADRLSQEQARFASGLAAFQLLTSAVERLGDVVDGKVDVPVLVDLMLATKLGMAEIYHELAGIADAADVADLPPDRETAHLVEESRAQLEEYRALHRTGPPR